MDKPNYGVRVDVPPLGPNEFVEKENVTNPEDTREWKPYLLLVSGHAQDSQKGNIVKDKVTGQTRFVPYKITALADAVGQRYPVIESPVDLVATCGPKFGYSNPISHSTIGVDKDGFAATRSAPNLPNTSKQAEGLHGDDTLEAMTIDQLRTLAAEEEIDLGHAKHKADIIAAIQAATKE